MDLRATHVDRRVRPLVLVRLQKRAVLRKDYIAHLPWWRRPIAGCLFSIPLVGLGLLGVILGQRLIPDFYFPGAPMIVAVLLVALIWGVAPALFAVLLSALALDYFYIPPGGQFSLNSWPGVLQILPFVIAGFIIALISGQRESARLRALFAEQEAQAQAEELIKANQQLEQANQLKDHFLSMASHELKTPITTIRGQAQVTLRRLAKQSELSLEQATIRTALEKIDEQTYRLNALVDDLLDLSIIQAGKIELRQGDCDLADMCRGVIEDQRLLTGRIIELEVPSTPVKLQADCERLSQVVVNLVGNAIKYSPQDRPVQVRVSQDGTVALIQVSDAGVGIPKDQQGRIFEAFYRASNARKSSSDGFGLGLAICKDIVERHGGRIWCESSTGKGSTFFVELPLR